MSLTKLERDKQKLIQDKCQQILTELLRDDDNKYCVDCDSKGPRWASWNLGIFLCIRCAGIHRNLGVHISKVKSVNLDSWTPEQVGSIQNMGNSKARAVYEANLPDNFRRPQADTALESFIRAKYEHKKYIAKEWVETPPKPAFDVEAELKKEKEKKKNKIVKPITPINSGSNESQSVNPIPRPTPNSNSSVNVSKSENKSQTSNQSGQQSQKNESTPPSLSEDLLSLDLGPNTNNNNEPFGFFTSATIETTAAPSNDDNKSTKKSLDDEEKDFFNQKSSNNDNANGSDNVKKLTKESILSLYSKTPANLMNGNMIGANNLISGNISSSSAPLSSNQQFSNLNPLFNPIAASNHQGTFITPTASSTNPFLANNANNNLTMTNTGDYLQQQQQQSIIQGLSSLNLQQQPQQQSSMMMMGGGGGQQMMNWFNQTNTTNINKNNNNMGSSLLTAANPFISGGSTGVVNLDQSSLLMFNNNNNNIKNQFANSLNVKNTSGINDLFNQKSTIDNNSIGGSNNNQSKQQNDLNNLNFW